jgi:hypothetical protein
VKIPETRRIGESAKFILRYARVECTSPNGYRPIPKTAVTRAADGEQVLPRAWVRAGKSFQRHREQGIRREAPGAALDPESHTAAVVLPG